MLDICILRAVFSSTFIIGKLCLQVIKPVFYVGSRMFISGLLLLAWGYFRNYSLRLKKEHIWIFIQVATFKIFVSYTFDTVAAQYTTSHKWALIYAFAPFVTAVFSWFFLKERFNNQKILGLVLGAIGFIPILMISNPANDIIGCQGVQYIPEMVMIFSMISYSYGWIVTKKLVDFNYSALMINGVTMLLGGASALILSAFTESSTVFPHCTGQNFLMWSALGVVSNIAAYQLYVILLNRHSPTLLSFVGLLDPLFVALFGWMFLSKEISWYFFISILILSVGLFVFNKAENQQKGKTNR